MSIHCPIPGQVTSVRTPLLFHDEAIVLGSEEIYLEDVSTPTIVVRIDENLKMVVEVLTDIASQVGCDDSRGLRVVAMDPEINCMSRVESAHFRLFRWQLPFVGLPLTKIGDRFGIEPKGIVQSAVQSWGMLHRHFCHSCFRLGNRGQPR